MKTYDCHQLSPEWWELHRGRPTAGNFDRILTAKTMKLSAAADEYICELIADTYSLQPLGAPGFVSRPMQNGIDTEPEARKWYELEANLDVQQVGFCTTDDGRFGCSPDGLIGTEKVGAYTPEGGSTYSGGLELKCPSGKVQVRYLLDGCLPAEYRAQVHGSLIVTGLSWWDFLSYAPGLPPLLVRVTPDKYTEALRAALEQFWGRYQETLAKFPKLKREAA